MAKRKAKKRTARKRVARTVRCIGKTKAGKRCKRMTSRPSKKCSLHWRQR